MSQYSQSDLDILYSPSQWSKRCKPTEIFQNHWQFCQHHTKTVRNQIPHELNISYGPGNREKLDIYGTDLPKDSPIFIHIHGGYYQEASVIHSDQGFLAKCLYQNKIKSIFIGYELCPSVALIELLKNIEKAVEKCLEYATTQMNSKGVYLSGHSAGAHAVAMLLTNYIPNLPEESKTLIKGTFLLSGIYDLRPLCNTSYNDALKLDQQTAKEMSPMSLDIPNNIKDMQIYVIAAEHDSPVFVEDSKKFHEHLRELKLASTYILVKNVDHFDILEKISEETYELTILLVNVMN